MKHSACFVLSIALSTALLAAPEGQGQEEKKVPKDSVRVSIPGCTKGYVFTAGPRTADQPGSVDVPEGMHLRMNGPKKLMTDIKAHEGSMIEITGLMKKGQYREGVPIGGGIRVMPGAAPNASIQGNATAGQIQIDVEGWRPVPGECRSR